MSTRVALVFLLCACSVDETAYENRLFTCDVTSGDATACGSGYGCYGAARSLGAPDFCAPDCAVGSPPNGYLCNDSSALEKCSPAGGGPCPSGMNCIRTDLIDDEGLCLPLAPCTVDHDCKDPVRASCLGTLLASTYAGRKAAGKPLETDHLMCYQSGCATRLQACAPGTTCLPAVIGRGAPDLCTPNCDSEKRCPPNFICSSKFNFSVDNPFCIPGFLGFRCNSKTDCVVGDCVMVGAHKTCVETCDTEADCTSFNNASFILPATFTCVNHQCLSPSLTLLDFCEMAHADTQCQPGEECRNVFSNFPAGIGICVSTCARVNGTCPDKNGFPQSCVPLGDTAGSMNACVVGIFGIPCQSSANCVSPLQCLVPVPAIPALKECTIPCTSHADCQNNPAVGAESYCAGLVTSAAANVCANKAEDGGDCIDPIQCKSGVCKCPTAGCSDSSKGTCISPSGGG